MLFIYLLISLIALSFLSPSLLCRGAQECHVADVIGRYLVTSFIYCTSKQVSPFINYWIHQFNLPNMPTLKDFLRHRQEWQRRFIASRSLLPLLAS